MKKYLIVLFSFILLVCGCSKEEVNVETETYNNYLNEIKKVKKSSDNIPFDVTFDYEKFNDKELRYKVIIDNVKEDIHDIEALAYHDKETSDIYPSIGIFDEKEKLEVGKKPSGIILSEHPDKNAIKIENAVILNNDFIVQYRLKCYIYTNSYIKSFSKPINLRGYICYTLI